MQRIHADASLKGMPNVFSEKCTKTWDEGQRCLSQGMVNSATNRFYYAVFQSIKGFAIQRGTMTIDSSDNVHRIALQIVGEGGGRGVYFRRRLNELAGLRVIADYKLEDVDLEKLKALLDDADNIRKYYIRLAGTQT